MADQLDPAVLERRYRRERSARLQAEAIAETAIAELSEANRVLDDRVAERTRELEQALRHVAVADGARSTFLHGMAHELSTPLHGILGLLELIEAQSDDTEVRVIARQAAEASNRLNQALRTLLEFAAVASGDVRASDVVTTLGRLGDEISARWRMPAARAGLLLVVDVLPDPSAEVALDPARIDQIVDALVDNAVRFGGEQVDVTLSLVDSSHPSLEIAVADRGPGMPAALAEDLFEPFRRGPNATDGFGVGLTLARAIASALGGTIEVADVESGTRVDVSLPLSSAS